MSSMSNRKEKKSWWRRKLSILRRLLCMRKRGADGSHAKKHDDDDVSVAIVVKRRDRTTNRRDRDSADSCMIAYDTPSTSDGRREVSGQDPVSCMSQARTNTDTKPELDPAAISASRSQDAGRVRLTGDDWPAAIQTGRSKSCLTVNGWHREVPPKRNVQRSKTDVDLKTVKHDNGGPNTSDVEDRPSDVAGLAPADRHVPGTADGGARPHVENSAGVTAADKDRPANQNGSTVAKVRKSRLPVPIAKGARRDVHAPAAPLNRKRSPMVALGLRPVRRDGGPRPVKRDAAKPAASRPASVGVPLAVKRDLRIRTEDGEILPPGDEWTVHLLENELTLSEAWQCRPIIETDLLMMEGTRLCQTEYVRTLPKYPTSVWKRIMRPKKR